LYKTASFSLSNTVIMDFGNVKELGLSTMSLKLAEWSIFLLFTIDGKITGEFF